MKLRQEQKNRKYKMNTKLQKRIKEKQEGKVEITFKRTATKITEMKMQKKL